MIDNRVFTRQSIGLDQIKMILGRWEKVPFHKTGLPISFV